jgi:3-deoxy-7-phosphoheptulonate synthase
LEQHPAWDLIACRDTATAVSRVKENNDPREAAIAGAEAASLHHMTLLKEGVEMNPRNFTRFVVISKNGALPGLKNKASLIYSVSDRPGSLFETLRVFADHRLNLVKVESRPIHDRPWEYLFYVDVEVDLAAAEHCHLLQELQARTEYFKYLGSYQKGGPALPEAAQG